MLKLEKQSFLLMILDSSKGVTREVVVSNAVSQQDHIKKLLKEEFLSWLEKPVSDASQEKFLQYEDVLDVDFPNFGEKMKTFDWLSEMEQEFDDAFWYMALYFYSKVQRV